MCPRTRQPLQHFTWLTYHQVNERLSLFGSGLLALRQQQQSLTGWHVGLYSVNRPEWVIAEQACNAYSLVTVALCKLMYSSLFLTIWLYIYY